jgi:hypothetical protein
MLKFRVVTTLMSNLSVICGGDVTHFSMRKMKKMQLIVGQTLMTDDVQASDFGDFSKALEKMGLERETIECALIYLLKLSDSY